jgi:uncharacterized protein (TIGR03067 family)
MSVRAVILFAAVVLIAADEPAKDVKKEMQLLQGNWAMVSMEGKGGGKFADKEVKRYKLTIKDDQWTVTIEGAATNKMTFQIDPAKSPKEIDLTLKGPAVNTPMKGIYKLEGDTLTLCRTVSSQEERPKEFKTGHGFLMVWKRVKE